MTAYRTFDAFEAIEATFPASGPNAQFDIDEAFWGYTVRSTDAPPMALVFAQAVAWMIGIACLISTLGLWLIPSGSATVGAMGMKLGATVLALAMAAFCLWFASRGSDSELQIDTHKGEVREMVRNRAGKATMIGRYGFDAIGSVFIDHGARRARDGSGDGVLVLRYRNTAQTLRVASGPLGSLMPLRDRLGRDLMLGSVGAKGRPVSEPVFNRDAA